MRSSIGKRLQRAAERAEAIGPETALEVLRAERDDLPEIMAAATAVRRMKFGRRLYCCAIGNAKCGACAEDCAYCAQSARHRASIQPHALWSEERMVAARARAAQWPVCHFGIVTSGGTLDDAGVERICRAIRRGGTLGPAWCASLGGLDEEGLRKLKKAGLRRYHHNLETARSFFPNICTTHSYQDRLRTLRLARKAGLEVCSGGILGMGESLEQRVELADALRREKVDSIPLNFLVPVAGTKLERMAPMKPLDILKTTAMFRLMNPAAELKVCAGRTHLGDLQAMIFFCGATGMMIGDLLTVAGRAVDEDIKMLRDLSETDTGAHENDATMARRGVTPANSCKGRIRSMGRSES